jgi:aspartate/methionine/tyrosine aminotransferase
MKYARMPIEVESPEEYGYGNIRNNLSESSITDRKLSDFGLTVPDLTLLYGEHRGSAALRTLIVKDNPLLTADDVLVTAGAAAALFIVNTAMLRPEDHLVVVRPNYATNLETPKAIGCKITFIDLSFEEDFRLNIERVRAALSPQTKMVSITTPHNPTGVMLSGEDLRSLADLTREHGCALLVDETYRDLNYTTLLPLAATLGDHVISVASLSKAYGVPGIRVGWLISRNRNYYDKFLAAKEQITICGMVIDEWIAEQILQNRETILAPIIATMRERRRTVLAWLDQEELLDCVKPEGGVVCFPRINRVPKGGIDSFYRTLLEKHGTYLGPGHWFEMPDTFFRLGYGWPTQDELQQGLKAISATLRS